MNISELILIIFVALCVFPKKKWPMLAYHMAKLYQVMEAHKQSIIRYWNAQVALYQLELNQKKAKENAPSKD